MIIWKIKIFFGLIIALFAVISITQGVLNALTDLGSQDFQYTPSRMLLDGINAFEAWQINKADFLLKQSPNYLPLLYYLLAPFGALTWHEAKIAWAMLNVMISFYVSYRLWNNYKSDRYLALLVSLLFLSSTPVRNTIGSGQHGLLITVVLIALFSFKNDFLKGLFLSIATTKYSIGTFFLSFYIGACRIRSASYALILIGLAYVAFFLETGTSFDVASLLSPMKATSDGFSLYPPFSYVNQVFGHGAVIVIPAVAVLAVLFLTFINCDLSKELDVSKKKYFFLLPLTLSSLTFAPHANYDFCLLALPFVFCNPFIILGYTNRVILSLILVYYWNGIKVTRFLFSDHANEALDVLVWGTFVWLIISSLFTMRELGLKENAD